MPSAPRRRARTVPAYWRAVDVEHVIIVLVVFIVRVRVYIHILVPCVWPNLFLLLHEPFQRGDLVIQLFLLTLVEQADLPELAVEERGKEVVCGHVIDMSHECRLLICFKISDGVLETSLLFLELVYEFLQGIIPCAGTTVG